MPIVIKTRREIEMMRRAGQIGCEILAKMREATKVGVSTLELDEFGAQGLYEARCRTCFVPELADTDHAQRAATA